MRSSPGAQACKALVLFFSALQFSVLHAAQPTITSDSFTGTTSVNTETVEIDNGCSGLVGCLFNQDQYLLNLSGMLNRDKTIPSHCITVQYAGDDWAFFKTAHDRTGLALTVNVIERRLGRPIAGQGVTELVCVRVSKPYLQGHKDSPLSFRLEGQRKTFVITVPASLLKDYLTAVSDWPDIATAPPPRKVVLGVQYTVINRTALAPMSIDADFGYLVRTVAPGSLAERSGLRMGDVILALDAENVDSTEALANKAQTWTSTTPGKMAVSRNGQVVEIVVRPASQ